MSHTLLLRLAGPMQSWGVQSRFTIRDTLTEPSKSGVIGLLCAALGRPRDADISDLAAFQMGVRVDREGQARTDYHTVQNVLKAGTDLDKVRRKGPSKSDLQPVVTYRHYLADAHFTVGLEGDPSMLKKVECHLKNPVWPLGLGRLAFAPGLPVYVPGGLREGPLVDVLLAFEDPWWSERERTIGYKKPRSKRLIIESDIDIPGWRRVTQPTRPDQPLSFLPRRFTLRTVSILVPVDSNVENHVSE